MSESSSGMSALFTKDPPSVDGRPWAVVMVSVGNVQKRTGDSRRNLVKLTKFPEVKILTSGVLVKGT